MSTDHKPFIGEIVHYWKSADEALPPWPGIVTAVANPTAVDLHIFTPFGTVLFRTPVRYCQPSDKTSVLSEHCRHIPAQGFTFKAEPPGSNAP